MQKKFLWSFLEIYFNASVLACGIFFFRPCELSAQNIAINTTGTAAAAANMLEVTQPATAGNNYVGIFSRNLSTATNAYAIWAEATGAATGKYAIVVPIAGGNVGIGSTTPQVSLHVVSDISNATTALHPYRGGAIIEGDVNTFGGRLAIRQIGTSSVLTLSRSNGTLAAQTALASADILGTIAFGGYDGTVNNNLLALNAIAAENWSAAAHGTHLTFSTINIGGGFGGTEKVRITSEGYVGVATTLPLGTLHVVGTTPNYSDRISNTNNEGAHFMFRKARGTAAAPLALQNGDEIGKFLVAGYDGSSYVMTGGISAVVNGTVAAGSIPTDLTFGVSSTNMGNPTTNEAMRITNTKRVGIGTTTPLGLLHLNATGQSTLLMSDVTTTGNQLGRIIYDGGTIVTGGGWVFQKMTDAGAFTSNLVSIIQNTGNVGINTITPLSKLDVAGGTAIGSYAGANAAPSNGLIVSGFLGVGTNNPLRPMHLYTTTANNDGRLRITATSTTAGQQSGLEFYGYGGNSNNFGGGILRDQNTNDISIFTGSGGTIKMLTVLDGGNVGVGTQTPETKLHVVNESTSTPRGIMNQQSTNDGNSAFLVLRKGRGTAAVPAAVISGDQLGTVYSEGYDGSAFLRSGAFMKFSVNGAIGVGSIPTDIVFNTGSSGLGTERMRILSSGNIGIGTNTPGSLLTLQGGYIQGTAESWGHQARTQGLIIMPEGAVTDDGAGNVVFGSTLIVMNPLSGTYIRIAAGSYTFGVWSYMWVEIPPTATRGTIVTPTVSAWSDTDRPYDGRDRILIAQRNGAGQVWFKFGKGDY